MRFPLALALLLAANAAAAQAPRTAPPGPGAPSGPAPDPATEETDAPRGGSSLTRVGAWPYGPSYALDASPDGVTVVSGHGRVLRVTEGIAAEEIVMPGLIRDIVLRGDVAYVATSHSTDPASRGVSVVQLDPAGSFVVNGVYGRTCVGVSVRGSTAYAVVFDPSVASYKLVVLRVAPPPQAPVVLGEVGLTGTAIGVDHLGTTVYVASTSGVAIVDASNPAAPVRVGTVPGTTQARRVAVDSTRTVPMLATAGAFTATTGSVSTFTLASPAAPALVGRYQDAFVFEDVAWASDAGPAGLDLYVAAQQGGILGLTEFGSLVSTGYPTPANIVPGVNRVVVPAGAPGAPVLLADYYYGVLAYDPFLFTYTVLDEGHSFSFDVEADRADPSVVYVAAGAYGVARLQAQPDGRLVQTGRAHDATWNYTRAVAQSATHLYVADGYSGVHVVDKATMERVTTITTGLFVDRVGVSPDGRMLVLRSSAQAQAPWTLRSYDVSVPGTPRAGSELSNSDAGTFAVGVDHVYVGADVGSDVYVFQRFGPAILSYVRSVPTAGGSVDVVLEGDRLYAYGGLTDVSVFDVTAPAAPALLGTVSPVSGADLDARGGALYLAGTQGTTVYDAQTPSAAPLVASYAGHAGPPVGIEATAGNVYLAEGSSGVERLAADIVVAAEPGAGATAGGLAVAPNPTAGRATVTLALDAPSDVEAEVVDVLGRRVRTLASGPAAAGELRLEWDGRDAAGRPVAAGLYVVRVRAGGTVRSRPLTVVR